MKKAIIVVALATLTIGAAPRIEKYDGSMHLDMGKTVQDALKKFDPYFQAWNEGDFLPAIRETYKANAQQTIYGVVGDFNSDKIKDLAITGRNRTHNLLLVAISDGTGSYKIFEVDRSPLTDPKKGWIGGPKGQGQGLWRYLNHKKPGRLVSPYESEPLQLRADAFEEAYFESASVIYYFKNGRFERFTASD